MKHMTIHTEDEPKTVITITESELEGLRNAVRSLMYPYGEDPSIEAGRIKMACQTLDMWEEYVEWIETPLPF